jgi:hypothetical protein
MPYHEFGVTLEPRQDRQIEIGGGARIARRFLPAIECCSAIRLIGRGHCVATARQKPLDRKTSIK